MTHVTSLPSGITLAGQLGPVVRYRPRRLIDWLLEWQQRAAQRRHLGDLDDRLLADMGLSRADARREAAKPFWRP